LAVREDDAEPEPLEDESMELGDGEIVAMAVKVSAGSSDSFSFFWLLGQESPLLWRTFAEDLVSLRETTAETELTERAGTIGRWKYCQRG
jgi:hypothetical protein